MLLLHIYLLLDDVFQRSAGGLLVGKFMSWLDHRSEVRREILG